MAIREGVEEEARRIRDAAGSPDQGGSSYSPHAGEPTRSPSSERSWAKRGEPIGQTEPKPPRPHGETSGEPSDARRRPAGTPSWEIPTGRTCGRWLDTPTNVGPYRSLLLHLELLHVGR